MNLIIVRHAQTSKNAAGRIHSHAEGGLTNLGKEQAKEAALQLKDEDFDVIYSSDLERCVETTNYIIDYHQKTPTHFTHELREINVGKIERFPIRIPNFAAKIGASILNYTNVRLPGAESINDVRLRVANFLNEIYDTYPSGNVLIVTHGVTMRILEAVLNETKNISTSPLENCAMWHRVMTKKF